jgi:RNA polymerase II subunit A small phosphatase-like protein
MSEEPILKKESGPSASSNATKAQSPRGDARQHQESSRTEEPKGLKEGHIVTVTKPEGEPPQLGPQTGKNIGRPTLVLDLDETLVHSSFRVVPGAHIVISVEIEGENHQVYVRIRPGCDEFLLRMAELYEIVIYTASMSKYANPLLDKLDKANVSAWRLFREACTRLSSGYVKDLSRLGRDLKRTIIIDNSPVCYSLQPDNAIPIQTWKDDINDRELLDLVPILTSLAEVDDIPVVLRQIVWGGDDEAFDENDG